MHNNPEYIHHGAQGTSYGFNGGGGRCSYQVCHLIAASTLLRLAD